MGPGLLGGGWRQFMSASEYVSQLAWYDTLLRQDDYVLGSAIFLMDGPADWDSFSVDGDAANLLAQYMQKLT